MNYLMSKAKLTNGKGNALFCCVVGEYLIRSDRYYIYLEGRFTEILKVCIKYIMLIIMRKWLHLHIKWDW